MKFLCDQMLAKLGRWLRAAGYDTEIAGEGLDDETNLAKAHEENRYLITRDRAFVQRHREDARLVYLQGNSLQDSVRELSTLLPIRWQYAPLTRCLDCNAVLEIADESDKTDVPDDVLKQFVKLLKCPRCRKIFWEGSHAKRILQTLEEWDRV